MKPELMKKFKELDQEIKEALRMFGTYTYFDKGPEEVMFTDKWCEWVESLPREDAIEFGKHLIENDAKDGRFETFLEGALYNSMPDMWDEGIREQREGHVGSDGSEPIEIKTTSLADVLDEMVRKGKI